MIILSPTLHLHPSIGRYWDNVLFSSDMKLNYLLSYMLHMKFSSYSLLKLFQATYSSLRTFMADCVIYILNSSLSPLFTCIILLLTSAIGWDIGSISFLSPAALRTELLSHPICIFLRHTQCLMQIVISVSTPVSIIYSSSLYVSIKSSPCSKAAGTPDNISHIFVDSSHC